MCKWKIGKYYKTKGSLIAKIVDIHELSIPKGLSHEEIEEIKNREYYGIIGYVYAPSDKKKGFRAEWTLDGKHSLRQGAYTIADLTTEEITDEGNA